MSPLLAATDFNDRIVPRSAPASQEPDRATAEASIRASADLFTETCSDAPHSHQAKTAPGLPIPPCSGAVISPKASGDMLSEASHFILSLIAAHEGKSESDVLAKLIAAAGDAIGLSPLLKRGIDDTDDLADLPGYARKAANRFRSGGP